MKAYLIILTFLSFSVFAEETEKDKKDNTNEKMQSKPTELVPDKEILLFLTEFTDAQGDWVDPEIFNQSDSINSNIELMERQNEEHPNNN